MKVTDLESALDAINLLAGRSPKSVGRNYKKNIGRELAVWITERERDIQCIEYGAARLLSQRAWQLGKELTKGEGHGNLSGRNCKSDRQGSDDPG